jgi:hypothetical protein
MDSLHEDLHVLLHAKVTGWKVTTQGFLQPLAKAEFWQKCQNCYTVLTFPNLFSWYWRQFLTLHSQVTLEALESRLDCCSCKKSPFSGQAQDTWLYFFNSLYQLVVISWQGALAIALFNAVLEMWNFISADWADFPGLHQYFHLFL